jgi:hypothetical protein
LQLAEVCLPLTQYQGLDEPEKEPIEQAYTAKPGAEPQLALALHAGFEQKVHLARQGLGQ